MKSENATKYTLAVDIGSTKIAIMAGKTTNNRKAIVAVHAVQSAGVQQGVIQNIDATQHALRRCIDGMSRKLAAVGLSFSNMRSANVSIAGNHVETMQVTITRVRQRRNRIDVKEIDDMLREVNVMALPTGKQILHVVPQAYNVDNQYIAADKVVGTIGSAIVGTYHVVTADTEIIEKLRQCLNQCGIQVRQFVVEPLASAYAVLTKEEMQIGVALIELGGGTSNVVVYKDNDIATIQMLPYGCELVTKDIAAVCSLTYEQAEKLKEKYGRCVANPKMRDEYYTFPDSDGVPPRQISAATLAQIIRARIDDLIAATEHQVEESGNGDVFNKIVLTGGGAELRALADYAAYKTGCVVRIGRPIINMADTEVWKHIHSRFAACVGLTFMENKMQSADPDRTFMDTAKELYDRFKKGLVNFFFNEESMNRANIL
jgi:cell division protein FtsA